MLKLGIKKTHLGIFTNFIKQWTEKTKNIFYPKCYTALYITMIYEKPKRKNNYIYMFKSI